MKLRGLVAITLLLSTTSLFCDTIRGLVVEEVSLKMDTKFEQTAEIALEEMASLQIEGLSRFLDAIQIELHPLAGKRVLPGKKCSSTTFLFLTGCTSPFR